MTLDATPFTVHFTKSTIFPFPFDFLCIYYKKFSFLHFFLAFMEVLAYNV